MPQLSPNKIVEIPFMPAFRLPMLTGRKTATTRTKRYGWPGDTFTTFNVRFLLTGVKRLALQTVAHSYYQQEGFDTPTDFIRCWRVLHPRKGYVPKQYVYLHIFNLTDNRI